MTCPRIPGILTDMMMKISKLKKKMSFVNEGKQYKHYNDDN